MTTTGALISTVERHLLAGDREQLNRLTANIDADDTLIEFDMALNGIASGAYIAIDLEIVYVWSVSGQIATVQRGMVDSVPAAHNLGTLAYVNPRFSKFDILNALNVELDDVTPELFQVKSLDLTTLPVSNNYAITATDLLQVLEVSWLPPGADVRWVPIRKREYQVLRNMPTTGEGASATGTELRIMPPGVPGRPMRVRYAAAFGVLATLTEDAGAVSGMAATMLDIPPLGAAARLMGVREAKRTFVESEVNTRRAAEVPAGSAARAAQALYAQVQARIRSEAETLRMQYPNVQ